MFVVNLKMRIVFSHAWFLKKEEERAANELPLFAPVPVRQQLSGHRGSWYAAMTVEAKDIANTAWLLQWLTRAWIFLLVLLLLLLSLGLFSFSVCIMPHLTCRAAVWNKQLQDSDPKSLCRVTLLRHSHPLSSHRLGAQMFWAELSQLTVCKFNFKGFLSISASVFSYSQK